MTTKTVTAVIVDDEPLAIEGLKLRLEKISHIKIIGEATDGDQAIRLCQELQPDVMFIDLHLPGISGLEVVQAIQSDIMPMVVFVTAYSEYAVQAFEVNAIDYIVKPASLSRLQQTVDRIIDHLSPQQQETEKYKLLKALEKTSGVAISELEEWLESENPLPSPYRKELVIKNSDNERVFVPVGDIRWIDAAGDYMCIHTEQENYIVRITMKKLESELDHKKFFRIHKSTLVNVDQVQSIQSLKNNESLLNLGNDITLKVSRNYSSSLNKLIEARQG